MTKGGKTVLKTVGLLYLVFLIIFFIQIFYAQELLDFPEVYIEVIDEDGLKDYDRLAEELYVPAAVLSPEDLQGLRFSKKPLSAKEWKRLHSEGVKRVVVFLDQKEKVPQDEKKRRESSLTMAVSFEKKKFRLNQPVYVMEEGKKRMLFAQGHLLMLRELALLNYYKRRGELLLMDGKIAVRGRGSVMQINTTVVFVMLNFAMLIALFYAFLWEPLTRMLDERAMKIRQDLHEASEERRRAEQLRQKYEAFMETAQKKAEQLRYQKLAEASFEADNIVKKAKKDAERIVNEAKMQALSEYEDAKKKLQEEIAEITISVAMKMLERKADEKIHRKVVEEFLSELERGDAE